MLAINQMPENSLRTKVNVCTVRNCPLDTRVPLVRQGGKGMSQNISSLPREGLNVGAGTAQQSAGVRPGVWQVIMPISPSPQAGPTWHPRARSLP